MTNLVYSVQENLVTVTDNCNQVASVTFNTIEDKENERFLSLIETADVDEAYQHQGIYTKMLKMFGENFADNQFFCSIGRSFEAASFWAKKLDLSIDETEGEVEKEEQERALIINEDLELSSNEYSPDLFELFW